MMRVSRRQLLQALGASGAAAGIGFAAYTSGVGRGRAVVTRTLVPVAGLPRALEGLRIGLLSDTHCGRFLPASEVTAAATILRDQSPDLVLLAGDYVSFADRSMVAPCADALAVARARFGVFAVTGNHDPEPTVIAEFERRGIQVLRDQCTSILARGERISLGGLRYWSNKTADVGQLFRNANGFPVLLSHDPRRFRQAAQTGVPLVLSGHTHGGQVVVPWLGAPAAARFPVVSGLARRDKTTLYVSRGLGTVYLPIRLNCPPEIAVLTLTRA